MGEPTRVVIGGIGSIPGQSMADKRDYASRKLDYIRTALMHEPRGHRDMFGSIILDPTDANADLGIIFMDGGGYLDMCGHGSIGAVTVALEMGLIKAKGPITTITLETPAGLVQASAVIRDQAVVSVSIKNVPSFLFQRAVPVTIPNHGTVYADIAFGGNFFALVDAAAVGLKIESVNADRLSTLGMQILAILKEKVEIIHPLSKKQQNVNLVEFCGPATVKGAHSRNVVVFGNGQIDRSPCGTGTCARMAALHADGELQLGEHFIHESIIGSTFQGKLLEERQLGSITAVIPEITTRAFITGIQQFIIDPADPLKHGFLL